MLLRMGDKGLEKRVQDWIAFCQSAATANHLSYIDEEVEDVEKYLPIDCDKRDSSLVCECRDLLEGALLRDPISRALRYAALRPFLEGGLANPYSSSRTQERVLSFRHLASLCLPDQLTDLADFKFELYNQYLAANWEKASEILKRISLLEVFPAAQLYIFRGQFWFLSVFGRRIEYELHANWEFDFFWPMDVPRLDEEEAGERRTRWAMESLSFARPEILQADSLARWILTAWCTNPRAQKPIAIPPDPIAFGDPDNDSSPPLKDLEKSHDGRGHFQEYVNDRYREFEPITPPQLSDHQKERLAQALFNLEEGCSLDSVLGLRYQPIIARILFCLGRLNDAADKYRLLADQGFALRDPITGASQSFNWELWFDLALCYRMAGRADDAIKVLTDFVDRDTIQLAAPVSRPLPPHGISWWIAKWYSEQGRHQEAARFIREELDSFFSPPASWQLSTILVLEAVLEQQEGPAAAARRYIGTHSDLQVIMRRLILEYWPTFDTLLEESRLHWLAAAYLSSAECPIEEARVLWFSNAVREYGWVLEHELKKRIFEVFRTEVQADGKRQAQARADFANFGLKFYRYLTGKPEIELGAMIAAIQQSMASVIVTDTDFTNFMRLRIPEIALSIDAMKIASDLRNTATHEHARFDVRSVHRMAGACRKVLDHVHVSAIHADLRK